MTLRLPIPRDQMIKLLVEIGDARNAYESWLQERDYSFQTRRAYLSRLNCFLGFLGMRLHIYKGALTSAATRDALVADYVAYLKEDLKCRPWTLNGYLTAMDSFYEFLGLGKMDIQREDLEAPCPRGLTDAEENSLLHVLAEWSSSRHRAIVHLLLSGLRLGELAELDLSDVRLRKGTVVARKRAAACREVGLSPEAREAVRSWVKERQLRYGDIGEPALLISDRRQRITTAGIDHIVRKIAKAAGIKNVSAETLRHTAVANSIKVNEELALAAKVAGHRKLESTRRYLGIL